MRPDLLRPVLFLVVARHVSGLQVTPGSPCAALCMDSEDGNVFSPDSSNTNTTDIVCKDEQFSSSDTGSKFEKCMSCLVNSKVANGTESDLAWLLYNIRYSVSSCLFGAPAKVENASIDVSCITEDRCGPLKGPLTHDDLDPEAPEVFGFCEADDSAFVGKNIRPCLKCLRSSEEQTYIANFIILLTGGCAYKPENGSTIHIVGDLFSKDEIGISPPDTGMNPGTKDEDPNSSTPAKKTDEDAHPFTKEAIGGLVGGVSGVFGIAAVLFFIYYRREKKYQRERIQKFLDTHHDNNNNNNPGGMAQYELYYRQDLQPRTDIFDEDDRANEALAHPQGPTGGRWDRMGVGMNGRAINSAQPDIPTLPAHPAYIPAVRSSESSRPSPHSAPTIPSRPQQIDSPHRSRRGSSPSPPRGRKKKGNLFHLPGSLGNQSPFKSPDMPSPSGGYMSPGEESEITSPMSPKEMEKRMKERPFRHPRGQASRLPHRDELLRQITVPHTEERPLPSGKSLLYG